MKVWLYVVQDGEFCKFGYTQDLLSRLGHMQSNNPRQLTLKYIKQVDKQTAFEAEYRAYTIFSHERVRGEWYKTSPDLFHLVIIAMDEIKDSDLFIEHTGLKIPVHPKVETKLERVINYFNNNDCSGKSNRSIAAQLSVDEKTVRSAKRLLYDNKTNRTTG